MTLIGTSIALNYCGLESPFFRRAPSPAAQMGDPDDITKTQPDAGLKEGVRLKIRRKRVPRGTQLGACSCVFPIGSETKPTQQENSDELV
jgi:hypothetical protein